MVWAQVAIAVVQAAVSIAQGVSQAKAAKDAAKEEGKIAMAQAEAQAGKVIREGERLQSSQMAAAGASGIAPVTGSPLEIMMETMSETALRREDELYGGHIRAWEAKKRGRKLANEAYAKTLSGVLDSAGDAFGAGVAGGMFGGGGGGGAAGGGFMSQSVGRVNSGSSWGGGASNYSFGVRY